MYLKGEFREKEAAARAILDLKAQGFGPDALDVFSNEPVEFAAGILDRPSRMSLVVVASALTFCLLTILFVRFTQYNYPLVTGGMPLFSFWSTGVVFYELAMLGAILSSFIWFLWESGLIRRKKPAPVPNVEPGVICLRVYCTGEQEEIVSRQLAEAGAIEVAQL
ncbi:MAG TPA: quinol:electron acceptor oxidoreductase subunit ActD [Bryobacteraceae bacterium]